MADGFGYSGFSGVPYPFWLSSPSPHPHPHPHPSALASHPVESCDSTQGGFDPMIFHGSYHRSQADWSNYPSYPENSLSQALSSSVYAANNRPGDYGPQVEASYKDMFYSSRESSSDFVPLPAQNFSERQHFNFFPTYSNSATSAPVSSISEMLIRNSQEPFFKPNAPSGTYASSNALDEQHFRHNHPGYGGKPESMNAVPGPPVDPYIYVPDSNPSLPMPGLKTQVVFDGNQTGTRLGDGRSFNSDVSNHVPENFTEVQSSFHGSSVEPVNFDVLLGYGETSGHVKPLSETPDFRYQILGSPGPRSTGSSHQLQFNISSPGSLFMEKQENTGISSLYQRPNTSVADSENGVSDRFLKNAIEDLNCYEPRYWSHFMVSSEGPSAPTMFSTGSESCGPMKVDESAQSAANCKSSNQPSEDVQASQKPCKVEEQMFDVMNRDKETTLLTNMGTKGSTRSNAEDVSTGQSPKSHICYQGDFLSPTSSPRVSSVVNAMHNLSEVLVYECFNNGSWLKLEQLENLDKVVDNLTKCLKKIMGSKTIAGEASFPTQAMHVSCPNVVNLNEASRVVTKDFQGSNVKPLDSFGFKEPVDKNDMTQSIKDILASNFPDSEENHPQTVLYKNLWLETEAALCSTTCMARYHRIKNEIGNLKLQNREIFGDVSTFMQEPLLRPQKSVPIMNNVEQEPIESLNKNGSNCGENVVTGSHDAPQSSRFQSDPLNAVLSLMSRSFTEQKNHGNLKLNAASTTEEQHSDVIDQFQILKHQETKSPDIDVIDRFQILKEQETNCKLKSQNCPETKMGEQEDKAEESEMANMSDVMDRFQILKLREAEQVQKSLNSLNIVSDSDSDSDSDNDQARNKTQMRDHHWSASIRESSQIEACIDSASGKGYEDWEHVLKDN